MRQQLSWALHHGLEPNERGYLAEVELNLLRPLSESAQLSFDRGSGSELQDTPGRPAKMKALHSSSALAVNVFDSWVGHDARLLQAALGLGQEIQEIAFEEQFPTGLGGNPPNLDITLKLSNDHIIGIESKYSEWLTPKSQNKEPFKEKYFSPDDCLWHSRWLVNSQNLAHEMYTGNRAFKYLDAAQLLKHALGLATRLGNNFSLYYIYYDWKGGESDVHGQEIEVFGALVGEELNFRALTYQELFQSFKVTEGIDPVYLNYLEVRYF